ncbi:hypothetical protein BCR41DRAFT_368204 [Lobosporangium transversale]|uniref:Uncharacterized protein n=1 Tax=Lobosporangium transversale TaxID=64571 RepID=A0A1Y2GWH6_9FUNG|nr:hypothetical protein BCR41DRAFT_368204 [Lobosporangium transversale]ORZ26660.1 hypothetical protein BCR41DRAFT_368204 [Lobosporangium transversale]|eukprot:XP_021884423.1 hypothetical protein BCR41DRAFT_368204 [Lobosporangium transversale]
MGGKISDMFEPYNLFYSIISSASLLRSLEMKIGPYSQAIVTLLNVLIPSSSGGPRGGSRSNQTWSWRHCLKRLALLDAGISNSSSSYIFDYTFQALLGSPYARRTSSKSQENGLMETFPGVQGCGSISNNLEYISNATNAITNTKSTDILSSAVNSINNIDSDPYPNFSLEELEVRYCTNSRQYPELSFNCHSPEDLIIPLRSLALINYDVCGLDSELMDDGGTFEEGLILSILKRCPLLEELTISFDISDIEYFSGKPDFRLLSSSACFHEAIVDYHGTMSMEDWTPKTGSFVKKMYRYCPRLRSIHFGMMYDLSANHWVEMMDLYGSQLESLNVCGSYTFDTLALMTLIGPPVNHPIRALSTENLHRLTSLNINGASTLCDKHCIFLLFRHLKALKALHARSVNIDAVTLIGYDWAFKDIETLEIYVSVPKQFQCYIFPAMTYSWNEVEANWDLEKDCDNWNDLEFEEGDDGDDDGIYEVRYKPRFRPRGDSHLAEHMKCLTREQRESGDITEKSPIRTLQDMLEEEEDEEEEEGEGISKGKKGKDGYVKRELGLKLQLGLKFKLRLRPQLGFKFKLKFGHGFGFGFGFELRIKLRIKLNYKLSF